MSALSHFNAAGHSHMVDVSAKAVTVRTATAETFVHMQSATLALIQNRQVAKGDVFEVARLAGIMAAKRTGELIPLCHPLGLDAVAVDLAPADGAAASALVHITATVTTSGKTGVEMEALTAVSIAALTVYDMCKSVDRTMTLGPCRLVAKYGGKSGDFRHPHAGAPNSPPAQPA